MKLQIRSMKSKLCAATTIILNYIEAADAFTPNTMGIHSYSILSNCIELSNGSVFNVPTSLSLAFSIDSISETLRPFGGWYSQEDDPIGRSLFYDNFSEENAPSSLYMNWDTNYFPNDVFTDVIVKEDKTINAYRPFLKATKHVANWTRKKINSLLLSQCESHN